MKLIRLTSGLVAVCAFVGSLATPASALPLIIGLDKEFSGGTPPAGTAPWVTATFQDIAGGVRLTISTANLTGVEFVSDFYFNLNPSKDPLAITLSAPGTGTQTDYNMLNAGVDSFKADGDGFFDFNIDLPPPPGAAASKFTSGETFVLELLAAGLTTADFAYASVNGPVGKTGFYGAAHVQGIGPDGAFSGWIGTDRLPDTNTSVPLPGTLGLLGVGLAILAAARRR